MKEIKDKDIIELIYSAEGNILDEKIKQVNKRIKEKLKDINIEEILKNTTQLEELKKAFDMIEENYSIKISQYNKEFYKQGFIDGVNLMMNCLIKD